MSHNNSDPTPLSQPLKVETDDDNSVHPETSSYYGEDKDNFNQNNDNEDSDSLGPLPPKWEKAYTESGEVYFIDHATGTSHWLDPRLSKFQKKSLEDCLDDELPYGWEKISDPNYGTYFIDHVNRRTQYENPVIQAKRQASTRVSRTSFTKDPAELLGQRFRTSIVKSSRGLGFTIVGGDDAVDEFLQIKSVVPKGPAWLDGRLHTGDVIVYVNDTCVLGYTHIQIVRLFQSIGVGSTVSLELCRGYPLPFDPNDPNTEVVTTIAVDADKRLLDTNYNFLDDMDASGYPADEPLGKMEARVRIVKGNLGFGFTIADSACGQRVKQILDRQRCKNLVEGDILVEINEVALGSMSHDEVVQVLKNCAYNSEATICVQRGAAKSPERGKPRKLDAFRSKTPTAEIYSTQPREVLPSRPKTPLVDTRGLAKTKDDFGNNNGFGGDRSRLRLSLIDNQEEEDELDLTGEGQGKAGYDYPPMEGKFGWGQVGHAFDCTCYGCVSLRHGGGDNEQFAMDGGCNLKKNGDYWNYLTRNDYVTMNVVLHRQETGFGFRIVGGIEDKSQVAVGHIVAGGSADMDGRIRSGDEIVSVDGFSVLKAAHRQVVRLMNAAASRGQVNLIVRRRIYAQPPPIVGPAGGYVGANWGHENAPPPPANLPPPSSLHSESNYDVTVQRSENEGFGFVIISSANKQGSTIGRLIEDSPAERCGRLRVGDLIVAVNHIAIMHLSHGDIVNLIKESGLSVTLTIAPSFDI